MQRSTTRAVLSGKIACWGVLAAALTAGLVACSSDSSGGGDAGAGGTGTGGTSSAGGSSNTGGKASVGISPGATSCSDSSPVTDGTACAKCANTTCCSQALACAADQACVSCFTSGTSCDANNAATAGALSCLESKCASPCGLTGGGAGGGGTNPNCWTIDCSAGCPSYCSNSNQTCPSTGKCGSSLAD